VTEPTSWDLPLLPIPELVGSVRADVCVIGLGGSGLAAIRRLQQLGVRRIVGIDAAGVAAGAAGRNGGFLLAGPAHFHHRAREAWGADTARAFTALTERAIDAMTAETPDAVQRTGSVRLAADPAEAEDLRAHHDALRSDGFAAELAQDPRGLLLRLPGDGVFHPQRRCDLLAERAWDAGAWLYGQSPVVTIEGGLVATPRGEVACGAVLVCVDGGLESLLPELAERVWSVRLQMLGTAPAPAGLAHGAWYYRGGLDYWQQLPDGRVLVGGCRDLDAQGGRTTDARPTAPVQAGLDRLLAQVVGARVPVTHRWAGRVGFTADALPLVEQVRPGVFVAGGYCGTGNVIGWLAGRALADRVAGRDEPELTALIDAARARGRSGAVSGRPA